MPRLARYFLSSALLASLAWPSQATAMGGSGPFEGLQEAAKKTTLALETPASSGSAVIIGNKGSTYYFLTAAHVAQGDPQKEEFFVYSSENGGKRYRVSTFDKPREFSNIDLMLGSFISNDKLGVALLFPLDKSRGVLPSAFGESTQETDRFASIDQWILEGRRWQVIPQRLSYNWVVWKSFNGRSYDKAWDIQGPPIVVGISLPTKALPVPLLRNMAVEILSRVPGNKDGYEMAYSSSSTVPGMSGGGVYAARVCPEIVIKQNAERKWKDDSGLYAGLIAIHGRSEEYGSSGGRSGVSLGIPINLVSGYLLSNAKRLGIPTADDYQKMVLDTCINTSFDQ